LFSPEIDNCKHFNSLDFAGPFFEDQTKNAAPGTSPNLQDREGSSPFKSVNSSAHNSQVAEKETGAVNFGEATGEETPTGEATGSSAAGNALPSETVVSVPGEETQTVHMTEAPLEDAPTQNRPSSTPFGATQLNEKPTVPEITPIEEVPIEDLEDHGEWRPAREAATAAAPVKPQTPADNCVPSARACAATPRFRFVEMQDGSTVLAPSVGFSGSPGECDVITIPVIGETKEEEMAEKPAEAKSGPRSAEEATLPAVTFTIIDETKFTKLETPADVMPNPQTPEDAYMTESLADDDMPPLESIPEPPRKKPAPESVNGLPESVNGCAGSFEMGAASAEGGGFHRRRWVTFFGSQVAHQRALPSSTRNLIG
jgi:hypothetical protein